MSLWYRAHPPPSRLAAYIATSASQHRESEQLDQVLRGVPGITVDKNGELITAKACDELIGPERGPEASSDLNQQQVAGLVSECVIDGFEIVEVQERHRRTPRAGDRGADLRLQFFNEVV